MFRTSKKFSFSAGHALDHLEAGRQCARPHGHNYTVEVIMQARTLSSDSFVRDPLDYRRIELWIRRVFDRQNLNEVFAGEFEDDIGQQLFMEHIADSEAWVGTARARQEVEDALHTTTENIARAIFLRLNADFPEIIAVRVGDTPDTWASYEKDAD